MKKIRPGALRKALANVRRSIQSLDRTLARLVVENGSSRFDALKSPRVRRISKRARATLVLQGRYMGYMRQLKPRQKAQVRKIREAKGVRLAIVAARRHASR